jgi:hypothetical protein
MEIKSSRWPTQAVNPEPLPVCVYLRLTLDCQGKAWADYHQTHSRNCHPFLLPSFLAATKSNRTHAHLGHRMAAFELDKKMITAWLPLNSTKRMIKSFQTAIVVHILEPLTCSPFQALPPCPCSWPPAGASHPPSSPCPSSPFRSQPPPPRQHYPSGSSSAPPPPRL